MIAEKGELERSPRPLLWTRGEYDRMLRLGLLRGRSVSLVDGVLYQNQAAGEAVPVCWTGEEYYRLGDAGLLDNVRVELVEGVIVEMSPINSPHATGVTLTVEALRPLFPSGFVIRVQNPLALGDRSFPEPDVAVVRGSARDFVNEHPRGAILVVEVADTSLRFDRTTKAAFYASAGIAEYWILNLVDRTLEVYRLPSGAAGKGQTASYGTPVVLGADHEITPAARPEACIRVADLLP